jgi:hypothetical protein
MKVFIIDISLNKKSDVVVELLSRSGLNGFILLGQGSQ